MAEKWFISDTHFLHANVLKFLRDDGKRLRHEFSNLEDMHSFIIKQWNSKISPGDKVYHLGDVTFQYHHPFNEIMSQLNGHKRLIVGNHDKISNPALAKWFDKIELWAGFKEFNFTATHIPIHPNCFRDGEFNVHGHVHCRSMEDPRYINVSVEVRNYTPVHIEELSKEIKEKEKQIASNTKSNTRHI